MGIWIVPLLVIVIAAAMYDKLSGRNLLLDTLTRIRLASRSLQKWDLMWSKRPAKTQVVICLTTTPSRLPRLGSTLKSLLAQQATPARIRIHVPDFSKREQCAYEIPPWLAALRSVEIVRCPDFGPATKLIPALSAFDPDQPLIVVDDDMIYPPTLVADLLSHAELHRNVAIGASGWEVPDDLTDRPNTWKNHLLKLPPAPVRCTTINRPWRVDILQGYSGYLVRARFFDLTRIIDYSQAPPNAFFVDDVWFGAHCTVDKMIFPGRRFCIDRWVDYKFFKRNSLALLNRGGGNPNQRNNTVMIRHFANCWIRHRAQTLQYYHRGPV